MRNTTENSHRWFRGTCVLALGMIIFALIGFVAYGQLCERCKMVTSAAEQDPGTTADRQMVESFAAVGAADAVTEWNQHSVAFTLTTTPALAPVEQARVMAIVQVAVHDAVSGLGGKYETYLPRAVPPQGASAEAAAIAAAHRALQGIFSTPAQLMTLETLYTNSLASHNIAPGDTGLAYGRAAAEAILAARANDGAGAAQFDYTPPGAGSPGVWTRINNAPALLPGWGNVAPFVIRSADQFRTEPPLALDSEEYAKDYNEIKEIGRFAGSTRTPLQTQIATFWRASPTAIWNPVLVQALAATELDISDEARIFALFYLAASDASVTCWETKYHYNFWRPQLAIRSGDLDGNDATEPDASWTPLFGTPPHPEYSSGHSTNSSALATVLESAFGRDPGMTFQVTLGGVTRSWSTFDEAVREVIDARVFSGIHFRTADEAGARQGRQVAQFVLTHALRPCRGQRGVC